MSVRHGCVDGGTDPSGKLPRGHHARGRDGADTGVSSDPGYRDAVTDEPASDSGLRWRRYAWPAAGVLAFLGGTSLGWDATLLDRIVDPPDVARAALVGVSVVLGLWFLRGAIAGLEGVATGERDLGSAIRGIRFVFLAVAAFAAASGWLLAHPLPFIVALLIAGVDIIETSFLLLVVSLRREG